MIYLEQSRAIFIYILQDENLAYSALSTYWLIKEGKEIRPGVHSASCDGGSIVSIHLGGEEFEN